MTDQVSRNLGAGLKLAREQSGLTLRQIADVTKLSVSSLTALENNRIGQLPGGIYRRAIVRSYASEVGLDPEETLRAFLEQYPDDVPTMAQLLPPPKVRSGRRLQALLLLSALLPILAGAVLYVSANARGSEATPVMNTVHASSAGAPALSFRSISGGEDNAVSMMVSVSSPTTLQIVADGSQVLARQLDVGEVFTVGLSSDVVLVGDDAGAVHFSINGRAGRALGDSGSPLTARISRDDYQDWLIQP